MPVSIHAKFTLYAVTYHNVTETEEPELVAAIEAEEHISIEITRLPLSLEGK